MTYVATYRTVDFHCITRLTRILAFTKEQV